MVPHRTPIHPCLRRMRCISELTVTSLLHKAWYVSDVRIEHPVAESSPTGMAIPTCLQPKQEKPGSQRSISVFDLGIRHLLLERGEIYYNNRKSELSADVHDLTLQSSFALLTKSYSGTLSYRDGHLQLQNANSIGHNFSARFVATPEEFKLESAELKTGSSRLLGCRQRPRLFATPGACHLRGND